MKGGGEVVDFLRNGMKEQNMYSMVLPVRRSERKWISAFFWTKRVAIILAFNLIGQMMTPTVWDQKENSLILDNTH